MTMIAAIYAFCATTDSNPRYASPYGATFNEQSNQPQMQGQVSETHVFSPNTVNQFNASVLFYGAVFTPSDPAARYRRCPLMSLLPEVLSRKLAHWANLPDSSFRRAGAYSNIKSRTTCRTSSASTPSAWALRWVHQTVTDLDFAALGGPVNGIIATDLTDFYNGGGPKHLAHAGFPFIARTGNQIQYFGWLCRRRLEGD